MHRPNRSRHLLAVATIAVVASIGATSQVAQAAPEAPDVPAAIQVEAGHKVFLVGHATGVQIYACTASGSAFSWSFVAPRADVFDSRGHLLMTHFGGPTWQTTDGSAVKGARVDGVVVDTTAIPWLLLSATATATGPDADRLSATTFIQRTATVGGLAPAGSTCNAETAGTTAEIPYTADYYFWKATGS